MTIKINQSTVFVCSLLFCFAAYSQQRFLNNQRMWNDMMFNPAKIVQTHGYAMYANHRQQYYTLGSQSPYLFLIGGKANLPTPYSQNMLFSQARKKTVYNFAVGGYYVHSYTGGVYDQNEISGQFGFQVKLNQKLANPSQFDQFNLGLGVKGINNRYRGNSIYNLYDQNDPEFTSLQVSNKYAISVIPGIQYINSRIMLDALYTFGPKDQTFGSLTVMGGNGLNNYFSQLAFRVNYFGNPNCQVAINKIQGLGWGFNNSWALNYGVNVFLGKKFVSSSSIATNPGVYVGLIYHNSGNALKNSSNKSKPEWTNNFSGSLNILDANLNTLPLGPSAELGLMYQRNSQVCECDRIYDKFTTIQNDVNSLSEMKALFSSFKSKCENKSDYKKSYKNYSGGMSDEIMKIEEELNANKPLDINICQIGKQQWACENLSEYGKFGITLVSSEAEWAKVSSKKACCCYFEFNENNKGYGVFYNALALKNIMNQISSPDSKYHEFRIADISDWEKVMNFSVKNKTVNNLYNCDGRSNSTLNLKPSGYFDEVWYSPLDGFMGYWVGNNITMALDCNSKGEPMFDTSFDGTDDRSIYGAYLIRLIKK
jgi:hypothetical protein